MYAYMYVCMYVCMYIICMYICMYVCMYEWLCIMDGWISEFSHTVKHSKRGKAGWQCRTATTELQPHTDSKGYVREEEIEGRRPDR